MEPGSLAYQTNVLDRYTKRPLILSILLVFDKLDTPLVTQHIGYGLAAPQLNKVTAVFMMRFRRVGWNNGLDQVGTTV